jgi:opacity protein-like surface antigen
MGFLKISFLFLFFVCLSHVKAQDFIVGLKAGTGKGSYKRIDKTNRTTPIRYNQYGISLAYSPYISKLSFESALEFEKNDSASYIYIPMGFRITLGKKLRVFFEGGGYYSILNHSYTKKFIMKNDFGGRIGIGLIYAVNKRWRIETGYYRLFGLGSPLNYNRMQPGNSYITEKYKLSSYNVELALKYRF